MKNPKRKLTFRGTFSASKINTSLLDDNPYISPKDIKPTMNEYTFKLQVLDIIGAALNDPITYKNLLGETFNRIQLLKEIKENEIPKNSLGDLSQEEKEEIYDKVRKIIKDYILPLLEREEGPKIAEETFDQNEHSIILRALMEFPVLSRDKINMEELGYKLLKDLRIELSDIGTSLPLRQREMLSSIEWVLKVNDYPTVYFRAFKEGLGPHKIYELFCVDNEGNNPVFPLMDTNREKLIPNMEISIFNLNSKESKGEKEVIINWAQEIRHRLMDMTKGKWFKEYYRDSLNRKMSHYRGHYVMAANSIIKNKSNLTLLNLKSNQTFNLK